MKRLLCLFILVSFFVNAVPPIEQIHLLVGARFCIPGGKVIDDNPFFTPLAGAIAWHSGLITGLVRNGPVIAGEKLADGTIANIEAITRLARYLFIEQESSIVVSRTDHSFVINQIKENKWPIIVNSMNEMHPATDITPEVLKEFLKARSSEIELCKNFKSCASRAINYTIGPTKDLPAAAVWLLMSAVWYACVDTLQARSDMISTNSELQNQFEKNKVLCENGYTKENTKIFIDTLNGQEIADEAALALLLYNRCGFGYPGYVGTKHVLYNGKDIPDCIENTIHNIMNFLVYDPDTRKYAPEKYLPKDARIYSYYTTHPTVTSHLDDRAVKDWFVLLQKQSDLTYEDSSLRQELSSSLENIIAALNNLLSPNHQPTDWQRIIQSPYQTVSLDNDYLTITKKRDGKPDIVLNANIHVAQFHAELRFLSHPMQVTALERTWRISEWQHLVQLLIDHPVPTSPDQLCAVGHEPVFTVEDCSWRHLTVYASPTAAQAVIECFKLINTCVGWTYNQVVMNTARHYISKQGIEADLRVLLEAAQSYPANSCTELAQKFVAFKSKSFAKEGFKRSFSEGDLINLSRAVSPVIFFESFSEPHGIHARSVVKTIIKDLSATERPSALRAIAGNSLLHKQLTSIPLKTQDEQAIIDAWRRLANIKETNYTDSFGELSMSATDLRALLGIDGMCKLINDLLLSDWSADDMRKAVKQLTDGMSSEEATQYANCRRMKELLDFVSLSEIDQSLLPKVHILFDSAFGPLLSQQLIKPANLSFLTKSFFETIAQKLTVADKINWLLSDGLLKKTDFISIVLNGLEEQDLKRLASKAAHIAYHSGQPEVLTRLLRLVTPAQFLNQFEDEVVTLDDNPVNVEWAQEILSKISPAEVSQEKIERVQKRISAKIARMR